MTLLVEDVEAAREGREQFEPASLSDAASQLSTFGVVIAIGIRFLRGADRQGRWMAIAAVTLATVEILFTATWTIAG